MGKEMRVILIIAAVLTAICMCIAVVVGFGALFYLQTGSYGSTPIVFEVGATSVAPTPETVTANPTPETVTAPLPTLEPVSNDTLQVLTNTIVPPSDLREIAMRILGIPDIPLVVSETPADHPVGTVLPFWASNLDSETNFQINAELVYRTDHSYFFIEQGLNYDAATVARLMDTFENEIYPTTRAFFGSEWTPGVDGDPRVYVLYARNLGFSVAAYYSSVDQYSQLANAYSNEKEMFYVNADTMSLNDSNLAGTLAHEFQHMIHWYNDRNEDTWLNEGASVLAELLNGYSPGPVDRAFLANPDLQVNTWADGTPGSDSYPHYGAAFLFMAYFLERFGTDATQALIAHPENGMASVDIVLAEINSGQTVDDFFADWVITNYVNSPTVGDGRYHYGQTYPAASRISRPTETVTNCPASAATRNVSQFAAHYIQIDCSGAYTLTFSGSQAVSVVPTTPYSGSMFFWGNRQDESDATLTRAFDLSAVSSATLSFMAWWQIETDWDYTYLLISTDNGETWQMQQTTASTSTNPNGNNLGMGYTGDSGGVPAQWVEQTLDLTPFVGQTILVRFEYITDAAVNRPGFVVDDISIPEIDYFTDFEDDDGGWDAEGFARIDNQLPQRWIIQVLQGQQVTRFAVTENGQASIALNGAATVVISPTTPFTTERAQYEFALTTP